MDAKTQALLDRTFIFGVRVLKYVDTLPQQESLRVPRYQVSKSGPSIGANYEESQAAESRRDFSHKVGVSFKEARETHYWLRVIRAVLEPDPADSSLDSLIQEAFELKNIFASIRKSSTKKS